MSQTFALSNRKKVRGWKTQIRQVERWRLEHLTPDWRHFERYDYDYCKIQIHPWNRLVEREPPLWLGRQMLHGLLDIHDAWKLAAPHAPYLKVWLKWPFLRTSQVVMAGESRLAWYGGVFRPVADLGWEEAKGFPPQFGPELLERLEGWEWQECLDEYPLGVPALQLSKRRGRTHRYSILMPVGEEPVTLVERGRVWVGTRRDMA